MKVTQRPWYCVYGYSVEAPELYRLTHGDQASRRVNWYLIRPDVSDWLSGRGYFGWGIFRYRRVVWVQHSKRFIPGFMAQAGKLQITPLPPKFYFRRRADAYILKLIAGQNV